MEIEGIELKPGELSRRNRYRVSWSDAETSLTTVIPAAALLDDGTRARLSIDCAGQARPAPQDRYCVRGRIVVIGSTYRANGDFHRVPGGEMPGSLVMINMIDSLLRQEHDFDELPMPAAVAFELGLILLLAWLFSHYERWEFMILVLATAGLVVICLPVSFWLLQRDVWFDIAPPLIGMILHEWWLRAEHAWESFMKGAQ
jgi:hypothetical protein